MVSREAEALAAVRNEMEAIPEDEVRRPQVPVHVLVQEARDG